MFDKNAEQIFLKLFNLPTIKLFCALAWGDFRKILKAFWSLHEYELNGDG
jgi:hypothetical protein